MERCAHASVVSWPKATRSDLWPIRWPLLIDSAGRLTTIPSLAIFWVDIFLNIKFPKLFSNSHAIAIRHSHPFSQNAS